MRRAATRRREENQPRHFLRWYTLQTKTTTLTCQITTDTHTNPENAAWRRSTLADPGTHEELAKRNMPNTITFIPHRLGKLFALIYRSKLNGLASLMRKGDDTGTRDAEPAGMSDTSFDTERRRGGDGIAQRASLKSGRTEPETRATQKDGMD